MLNSFILSKFLVIELDTAIPEIPVSKIEERLLIVIPPEPIIGVLVFNTSIIVVKPFKPNSVIVLLSLFSWSLKGFKQI